MKTLKIVAFTFFGLCIGAGIYFAMSGPGDAYDLKFVLPVDTADMPQSTANLHIEGDPSIPPVMPRVEAQSSTPTVTSRVFQFGDKRTPNEQRASE